MTPAHFFSTADAEAEGAEKDFAGATGHFLLGSSRSPHLEVAAHGLEDLDAELHDGAVG